MKRLLTIILQITFSDKKKIILNFSLDTSLVAYKLAVHEKVISEALRVKDEFNGTEIVAIATAFESFGKLIVSDPKIDQTTQIIQSLFLYNATLLSISRSYKNNVDCGCTPHPAYFVGKISFWCQEDYYINPEKYISDIDKSGYKMKGVELDVYAYLVKNKDKQSISINNLQNIQEPNDKFMRRVANVYHQATAKSLIYSQPKLKVSVADDGGDEGCWFGLGSDLGCCGNYAGCCWLATMECLMHDLACLKCDHWYCGPQCKVFE